MVIHPASPRLKRFLSDVLDQLQGRQRLGVPRRSLTPRCTAILKPQPVLIGDHGRWMTGVRIDNREANVAQDMVKPMG
jgi:hypothetical protein